MRPLPREVLIAARLAHGLVTADCLTAHRVVGRFRTAAIESGQLVRVHRGVFRLGSHAATFEQRCLAALLAASEAALSGPTGGRIYGIRKLTTDEVHVMSLQAVRLEGVSAHRTDLLGPHDVTVRNGFRVLKPPRLLCDLASHLDTQGLESVYEQMLDRRLITVQSARAAANRFMRPGRPGSLRLGRVLDSRPDWLKPVDSDLELRLWRQLAGLGIQLERQVPVLLDSGDLVHLDMADTALRFGIEVDHVTWHGGRLDVQRDKRRDRELAQLGWSISRVTDDDVNTRLDHTARQLLAIARQLAQRSHSDGNPSRDHPWSPRGFPRAS